MADKTIVIIGSGIAGLTAAEWARKTDPDVKIIVLSENPHLPYHRPRLPGVIMDPESVERIVLRDEAWYEKNEIDLRRGVVVKKIDPNKKTLELTDKKKLSWDKLILATGSRSFMPPMEGNDLEGVFTLWTLDSALAISDYIKSAKNAVVIGGGLLGLEVAYALKQRGLHTTILERGTRLLARQLDERASAMFEEQVDRVGVHVQKEASTKKIVADPDTGKAKAVLLQDGTELPADIVVVATGVRARLELFDGEEIAIDRCFVTNNKMETSLPDIYAAGDCALMDGLWYGLWSVATREGKTAGINAAGGDAVCTIPSPPYLVNTMETRIASAGNIAPKDSEISSRIHFDETQLTYDRRNFLGESLVGYILLGDTTPFSMLSRELQEG
jgi:NAD(P)H-nitrite reductase large subunit